MKQDKVILCCDMDGTCVTHMYPDLGRDIGATSYLKEFTDKGGLIILWTMRSGGPNNHPNVLTDAVNWFKTNNIPLYGINKNPDQNWSDSPKAYGNYYLDDAAIGAPVIVSKLEGERPYIDWSIAGPFIVNLVS